MIDPVDRYLGALLGLAVGDAVGTTVEFKARGTFPPVTDMVGGGPFGLAPGQWTDDTSMALCLAASLVECGGFDARDQMDRYRRWVIDGYMSSTGHCFDVGLTVHDALSRYQQTGEPMAGSTDEKAAGNGSLMRLAPVVLFGDASTFTGAPKIEAIAERRLSRQAAGGDSRDWLRRGEPRGRAVVPAHDRVVRGGGPARGEPGRRHGHHCGGGRPDRRRAVWEVGHPWPLARAPREAG